MADLKKITIHSDGACQGNPGPGGWAAVLEYQNHLKEIAGGDPATTNNRMEIQAAVAGLRSLNQPCEVELFTDSEYLRDGITRWLARWKRVGWRTKDRKPVRNQDLWRELDAACAPHVIHWHWLKGHAGHALNERCDQLAVAEIARIRKQHSPDQLKTLLRDFQAQRSLTQEEKRPDLPEKKVSEVIQKALGLPGI
jgi:ribonuclease HI